MTLLYIIGLLIVFIFITVATEIEWYGWSTITLTASVVTAHYLHIFDIIPYVKTHLLNTIIHSIYYIAMGVLWSFPKWFLFLRNERDKTREWLKEEKRRNTTYRRTSTDLVINIPQASHNKGKIVAWIAFWPFSFIGTVLNDPIRKMFNFIFDQFKGLYQKMANAIFKDDVENLKNEILQEQEKNKQSMVEKIINKTPE